MSVVEAGVAAWPTSDWFASRARHRAILAAAAALAVAAAYAIAILATGGEKLLVMPLVCLIVVIAVFAHPVVGVYLLFGAGILLEQFPIVGLAPITAQTNIYTNLSTFTPIPLRLSIADLLLLLTVASCIARRLAVPTEKLHAGPFGGAVAGYIGVFAIGTLIGVARGAGWDPNATLAEVRGPLYACVLYFLVANLIRRREQLRVLLWMFVLFVGIKAVQAILNYQDSLSGPNALENALVKEAITAHEDVVFFDLAIALMAVMAILRVRSKLAYALFALQPVILIGEMLAQRRVGFVALGAVLVAVVALTVASNPRLGVVLTAVGALVLGAYCAFFWDNAGPLGEPIRALRSVVDPSSISSRDLISGWWREIENNNIAFTVRQLPFTGVGVGQEYLFQQEPNPLLGFTYWRFITHNALLWLWLKAGVFGAFALWFLVGRVLLFSSRLYVRLRDPELRLVAAMPLAVVVIQIVFSAVELGLNYSRNMILLGTVLGMAAILAQHAPAGATVRTENDR